MTEEKKETSAVTKVVPAVEPSWEPTRPLYTCNHCGAKVVPQEIETPSGKNHRCPECGKFMKPLIKKEVSKREEEERGPLPPPEVRYVWLGRRQQSDDKSPTKDFPRIMRNQCGSTEGTHILPLYWISSVVPLWILMASSTILTLT